MVSTLNRLMEPITKGYRLYADSFVRHLRAENKSERTIKTYLEAIGQLATFCSEMGMPGNPTMLTREHVESYIGRLLETKSPATASNRYRGLRVFFEWLLEEDEVSVSPMAKMRPPTVPEEPTPLLDVDEVGNLLAACAGKGFEERRDTAVIRLLIDTGLRRSELAYLIMDDLDWSENLLRVKGKGGRIRFVPFGRKAARDLDRYLRVRERHRLADDPALWLGRRGPMTDSGVAQIVSDRARQAGLGRVHPHMLRHSFANMWLENEGQEQDLMRIAGWKSRTMLARYGAARADDRARLAHRRLSPGDRV